MNKQTDGQTDGQIERQTDIQTYRQTDRLKDRQKNRQMDRKTDRQTNVQTDRQTHRKNEILFATRKKCVLCRIYRLSTNVHCQYLPHISLLIDVCLGIVSSAGVVDTEQTGGVAPAQQPTDSRSRYCYQIDRWTHRIHRQDRQIDRQDRQIDRKIDKQTD